LLRSVQVANAGCPVRWLDLFRRHAVWDYSTRNIEQWARLGVRDVRHLPLGYVPQLSRIPRDEEDIDVFIYDSVNQHRQEILTAPCQRGIKTEVLFGAYGTTRDRVIARAKIVLNLHYHESKVFEVVRVSYLLANRRFVISERGCEPEEDAELAAGGVFANYGHLAEGCASNLGRPDERERIARGIRVDDEEGHERVSAAGAGCALSATAMSKA
jgi:hypothetical protein